MSKTRPGPNKHSTSFKVLRTLGEPIEKKSHDVTVQRKVRKDNKDWFVKVAYDKNFKNSNAPLDLSDTANINIATREVVAQELFRLYIPSQPKTRLLIDHKNVVISVASEAVPNFTTPYSLPDDDMKNGVLSGKYTGLGKLCVMALFLNEDDFKPGNVALSNNQFIKIDGDWCFANLLLGQPDRKDNVITEAVIADLPFVYNYEAYNWLNHRRAELLYESSFLDFKMSNHAGFRQEVNEQILKVLLTPPELLKDFFQHYDNPISRVNKILDPALKFLVDRQQQLFKSALDNASFLNYMESNEAKRVVENFKDNLAAFKTSEKNFLLTSRNKNDINAKIDSQFIQLQATAAVNNLQNMQPSMLIPPPPSYPPPPVPQKPRP